MPPTTLARRAVRAAERRIQRLLRVALERRLGDVEFGGWGYLQDRGIDDAEQLSYGWTPWPPIRAALKALDPGPDDVFVDLGCGKGQAVLVAAGLPFGATLGVEIAEDWAQVAQRNVEVARERLVCPDVRVDCADVLTWPVPDALSVVYLYCPFVGTVFQQTVERLLASYDAHPRPLRLVYNYPWEHNWLLDTGRFSVVDVRPSRWPRRPGWWRGEEVIVTYEAHAAGALPSRPLHRGGRALKRWRRPVDAVFFDANRTPDGPTVFSG